MVDQNMVRKNEASWIMIQQNTCICIQTDAVVVVEMFLVAVVVWTCQFDGSRIYIAYDGT